MKRIVSRPLFTYFSFLFSFMKFENETRAAGVLLIIECLNCFEYPWRCTTRHVILNMNKWGIEWRMGSPHGHSQNDPWNSNSIDLGSHIRRVLHRWILIRRMCCTHSIACARAERAKSPYTLQLDEMVLQVLPSCRPSRNGYRYARAMPYACVEL